MYAILKEPGNDCVQTNSAILAIAYKIYALFAFEFPSIRPEPGMQLAKQNDFQIHSILNKQTRNFRPIFFIFSRYLNN